MSKSRNISSGHTLKKAHVFTKTADHRNVDSFYGINVFDRKKMKERLSKDVYNKLISLEAGKTISEDIVEPIAAAVKDWALENGVSHYCHWFQPQTGSTAEKHDSLFEIAEDGTPFEKFTASLLKQAEPDASSFPHGGMRSTFEARGYTTWDPSSPIFIMEAPNGKTLCIPSAFVSYTGQALDEKTPLLKSLDVVRKASVRLLGLLGKKVSNVTVTLGPEQEYFLFDRAFLENRKDLALTGRSLLGHRSPKGQQLEDQYFGSIPPRVLAFKNEVEYEAAKLGIPLKTRHNEVAPSQFEIAPIFEDANKAIDHNLLLMDIMRKIAPKHDLAVTFYEKPFSGINGSGKHVNWSMVTDDGINLLNPGKTPSENVTFLMVLASVLKGVHSGGDILRASVASAGNDHRLGACEAPPAIISVFLGDYLESLVQKIETDSTKDHKNWDAALELGVSRLLQLQKDNTDRNRTSPFAFTSNKFEFRAVGGNHNISIPVTMLNALVANGINYVSQLLEENLKGGKDVSTAAFEVAKKVFTETKTIRYNGNNYGDEWIKEAEKRGLPHLRNTPETLKAMTKPEAYQRLKDVYAEEEFKARIKIQFERYIKVKLIEAECFLDMVQTGIIPAALSQIKEFSEVEKNLPALKKYNAEYASTTDKLIDIVGKIRDKVDHISKEEEMEAAFSICDELEPMVLNARACADMLESKTDDRLWPFAHYSEILFSLNT